MAGKTSLLLGRTGGRRTQEGGKRQDKGGRTQERREWRLRAESKWWGGGKRRLGGKLKDCEHSTGGMQLQRDQDEREPLQEGNSNGKVKMGQKRKPKKQIGGQVDSSKRGRAGRKMLQQTGQN